MKFLLIALSWAVLALFGATPPANACSCAGQSTQEKLARASIAFTGRAVSWKRRSEDIDTIKRKIEEFSRKNKLSNTLADLQRAVEFGRTFVLPRTTFSVISVQKGVARANVIITHGDDESACGVKFQVGEIYRVYARGNGDVYHTNLCMGSTRLKQPPVAE